MSAFWTQFRTPDEVLIDELAEEHENGEHEEWRYMCPECEEEKEN